MIQLTKGSLLESGAETYVNPVNCVGIMGKDIAVFKSKVPFKVTP